MTSKQYRKSSYVISVQVDTDKYVMLHGYSGAMDIVDKNIVLDLERHTFFDETVFDKETFDVLCKRGYLTSRTEQEERLYVCRMAKALCQKDSIVCSAFTFMVSYNCNFKCPYCFEQKGTANEPLMATMSKQCVDACFEAMEELQQNKLKRSTKIALFGGEPLLKENVPIVEYIVNEGVKRGYKFYAVTNGYDLDSFEDALSPERICSLQVTIDGMENLHNSKRVHKTGYPTFAKIISNIGLALRHGIFVTVRFNADKTNTEQLVELKRYFDELGYTKNRKFTIDAARLVNYDEKLEPSQKNLFFTQKEFIQDARISNFEYGCHDYSTYDKIWYSIKNKAPLPYKGTFCGAQTSSYVFDPFYKIYPCWEVVGNSAHQIGSFIGGKILWNKDVFSKWKNVDVTSFDECLLCECALFCGGGCLAKSKNHCTQMKGFIENAIRKIYKQKFIKPKNYE